MKLYLQILLHTSQHYTPTLGLCTPHISRRLERQGASLPKCPIRQCHCCSHSLQIQAYGSQRRHGRTTPYHFWQCAWVNPKALLHINQSWLCADLGLLLNPKEMYAPQADVAGRWKKTWHDHSQLGICEGRAEGDSSKPKSATTHREIVHRPSREFVYGSPVNTN